jgi:hypothetical protein
MRYFNNVIKRRTKVHAFYNRVWARVYYCHSFCDDYTPSQTSLSCKFEFYHIFRSFAQFEKNFPNLLQ